jgi:hypothetical protein
MVDISRSRPSRPVTRKATGIATITERPLPVITCWVR